MPQPKTAPALHPLQPPHLPLKLPPPLRLVPDLHLLQLRLPPIPPLPTINSLLLAPSPLFSWQLSSSSSRLLCYACTHASIGEQSEASLSFTTSGLSITVSTGTAARKA